MSRFLKLSDLICNGPFGFVHLQDPGEVLGPNLLAINTWEFSADPYLELGIQLFLIYSSFLKSCDCQNLGEINWKECCVLIAKQMLTL